MAEWLILTDVGSNPTRDFGSFVEDIQLAYETSVILLRCPLVLEIMHGGALKVFLYQ